MSFILPKNKANPVFSIRNSSFVIFFLILFLCLSQKVLVCQSHPSENRESEMEKLFRSQYLQLLMEKGICDDQGREIEGRMRKRRKKDIEQAKKSWIISSKL
jgi:hypothetical protein